MIIEVVEKVTRTYEINCSSIREAKERALHSHRIIDRKTYKKTKNIEVIIVDESNESFY